MRAIHLLSAMTVGAALKADKAVKLHDGGGLYLIIKRDSASWLYRYTVPGQRKSRHMGLGSASKVTLDQARKLAADARELHRKGLDPISERNMRAGVSVTVGAPSFEIAAERYLAVQTDWATKHKTQWGRSLAMYIYPRIGGMAVDEISAKDVADALAPLWGDKRETGLRIRSRIEMVIDAAFVRDGIKADNPAAWSKQRHLTPRNSKPPVKHHEALPYRDMPVTMGALMRDKTDAALMLRFIILTAARYSEVAGARWHEINLRDAIWTIPAGRMKAREEHTVPLPPAALDVLTESKKRFGVEGLLFPGLSKGKSVSGTALGAALDRNTLERVTVHGFRSTFRDWAGDMTDVPREVAEAALAHSAGSKVERAYRRGTAFTKRRVLMQEWAGYCLRDA